MSENELQKKCDVLNEKFPVGTPVRVRQDFRDIDTYTHIRHPFTIMSRQVVGWLEGISGCYHSDWIKAR